MLRVRVWQSHHFIIYLQYRRPQFDSWVWKIHWRRDRPLTPVFLGCPCGSAGKESPAMQDTWVCSLGWEDLLEKGKATHSCILAWRIQSCATLWTVAHRALLSVGFSSQEYWSGLPCPPPRDLLDPWIQSVSLMSPALAGWFFTTSPPWKAKSLESPM